MSCASETYSSTMVGSPGPARYCGSGVTPRVRAGTTATADPALVTVIADSTRRDPEYVWGDEGPLND